MRDGNITKSIDIRQSNTKVEDSEEVARENRDMDSGVFPVNETERPGLWLCLSLEGSHCAWLLRVEKVGNEEARGTEQS